MESSSLPKTYRSLAAKEENQEARLIDRPLSQPGPNQVLVKVAFIPINPTDVICLNGGYRLSTQSPYPVGREASGTVVAVGESLKRSFKVGDRVHVHGSGTITQYIVANTEDIAPIQEGVTLEEAASHIINPSTVAYMAALTERGGHKAAINTAASSALGKMFIRYFKEKGIPTINIVRNDKYIDELKAEGANYVLNSETPDFGQRLKEIAEKEQATISFDAVNTLSQTIVKNQPPNSTCYVYGVLGGGKTDLKINTQLEDGKAIKGLLYFFYLKEAREKGELDKFYNEIHSRLKTTLRTNIQKVFPLENIFEALEFYEKNASQGKILLKAN